VSPASAAWFVIAALGSAMQLAPSSHVLWPPSSELASTAYQTGWKALEQGEIEEAERAFREAHFTDPKFEPASSLVRCLDRLKTPFKRSTFERLSKIAPGQFQQAESDHIILLHQHESGESRQRIAELERVLVGFYLLFEGLGLSPQPASERLVVVWYRDAQGFREFLKRDADEVLSQTSGYYSPSRRVLATIDARSDSWYQQGLLRLPKSDGLARDRLEQTRVAADLGNAAHELIHALLLQSGVIRPDAEVPLWLQEGIATQFEVVTGGHWGGFGRVNQERLKQLRAARSPISLSSLLADQGFGHGQRPGLYGAAWAWVYYLRTKHATDFVSLFDTLNVRTDAESEPTNLIQMQQWESDWRGFVDGLQPAR
jgi:Protein of unknown function (DUF1570)